MEVNSFTRDYLDKFIMLLDVIFLDDKDILTVAIEPIRRIASQSPLGLRETIEFLNYTIAEMDIVNAKKGNNTSNPTQNPHDVVAVSYADYLADKQRFISKLAEIEMQLIQHTENHK